MRKTLSYKAKKTYTGQWTLRLIIGALAVYGLSMAVLALFRHFGGEQMINLGFLCVFILMPAMILGLFALPTRLVRKGGARKDRINVALLLALVPFFS